MGVPHPHPHPSLCPSLHQAIPLCHLQLTNNHLKSGFLSALIPHSKFIELEERVVRIYDIKLIESVFDNLLFEIGILSGGSLVGLIPQAVVPNSILR